MATQISPTAAYELSPRLVRRPKLDTIAEEASPKHWAAPSTLLPRPRRASDGSITSRYSRVSGCTISSYYEGSLDCDSSDDLYDVSDSESDREGIGFKVRERLRPGLGYFHRDRNPELDIPSPRHWPVPDRFYEHTKTGIGPRHDRCSELGTPSPRSKRDRYSELGTPSPRDWPTMDRFEARAKTGVESDHERYWELDIPIPRDWPSADGFRDRTKTGVGPDRDKYAELGIPSPREWVTAHEFNERTKTGVGPDSDRYWELDIPSPRDWPTADSFRDRTAAGVGPNGDRYWELDIPSPRDWPTVDSFSDHARTGVGPDLAGPDRVGPDRVGLGRRGPDRLGPDRIGPDWDGTDQDGYSELDIPSPRHWPTADGYKERTKTGIGPDRAGPDRVGPDQDGYSELDIPSPRHWPTADGFKKSHAVPITPVTKIALSSEILSKIPSQAASSATPSLDGSLSSDQQASLSTPSTPDTTDNPADRVDWDVEIARASADFAEHAGSPIIEVGINCVDLHDSGVQLPPEAMDLLQHLGMEFDGPIEVEPPDCEMQEISIALQEPAAKPLDPISASSEYSISQLSVPSPGRFFSSLDGSTRMTWSTNPTSENAPPSSTTAEHFYNAPWNGGQLRISEKLVNPPDGGGGTSMELTRARFVPCSSAQTSSTDLNTSPLSSPPMLPPELSELNGPIGSIEINLQLQQAAESALSRTVQWAAQQSEVLHVLAGKDPPTSTPTIVDTQGRVSPPTPEAIVGKSKRSVKFLDTERANAAVNAEGGDSLFYHAFQTLSNQSSPTDSFVHRHSRFDAIQALRSSLRETHIDSLLGHFSTVDPPKRSGHRPISSMPGADEAAVDPEAEAQKEAIIQRERERQAFEQVAPAMWIMEGMRFLAGGRLLNSPGGDVLARATPAPPMGSRVPPKAATRVLDLGGQPQCDWGWACAREFPNVRTYTATCDSRAFNLSLRGPRNHRVVHVDKLYQLPFPNDYFNIISARSLHQFLHSVPTSGTSTSDDEYDACLKECLRVLKPGGFLEYFLLDAELAQPGPKGEAASVEFAVNLKRSGYDPAPTRSWLRRVRQAGFTGMKRAWMFLPLGAIQTPERPLPETPPPPDMPPERVVSVASGRTDSDVLGRGSNETDRSTERSSSSNSIDRGRTSSAFSARSSSLPPGAPSAKRGNIGALVADFKYEGDRPVEAVQGPVGCAADAAHVSGLVGSCLWERWMLKLQMEMGREVGLLDGVGAVVEEGRRTGAGWRSLSGWARKPLATLKTSF